jgi:hypothetical protein
VRPAGRLTLILGCAGLMLSACGKSKIPVESASMLHASLEPDSAGLGDPVTLTITAVLPANAKPLLPGDGDSLGAWKVLRRGPLRSTQAGDWVRHEREITVAAYRLGAVGPDTLFARGVRAAGDTLRLAYAPPRLQVKGVLPEGAAIDPSSARDIRDVVSTGPVVWPWIVGAGAIVLAALLFLWRRLRARRKRILEETIPAGPTPEEEFERAIELLLASGLLEQGFYREFYYRVSGAVRLYLERVHGLPLLESTSSEVDFLLGPRIGGSVERAALRDWLTEGDLVKYARMERLQAEARNYLDRSLNLVRLLASSGSGGILSGASSGTGAQTAAEGTAVGIGDPRGSGGSGSSEPAGSEGP